MAKRRDEPPPATVRNERARLSAMADNILETDKLTAKAARKAAVEAGVPVMGNKSLLAKAETSQVKAVKGHVFNLKSVADVLIDAGLNPAEEILRVLPSLQADVKAKLLAELLQYVQPKLKSVEQTTTLKGPDGQALNMTLNVFGVAPPKK